MSMLLLFQLKINFLYSTNVILTGCVLIDAEVKPQRKKPVHKCKDRLRSKFFLSLAIPLSLISSRGPVTLRPTLTSSLLFSEIYLKSFWYLTLSNLN